MLDRFEISLADLFFLFLLVNPPRVFFHHRLHLASLMSRQRCCWCNANQTKGISHCWLSILFLSSLVFFFLLSRRNNGGLLRQTVYAVNNTVTLLLLIIAVIVGAGTNEEKLCSNVRHDSLAIQTSSIELHYVQSVTFLDCFCCCCLPWWRVRPSRSRNNSLRVSLLVVKREGERRTRIETEM